MGPAIVLLFWAVLGTALACFGAVALMAATAVLTIGVRKGRGRAIAAAGALPFAGLVWTGFVTVAMAVVGPMLFDRDMGIGDAWYAPLDNGYRILMIDTVDTASICDVRIQALCADPPLYDVESLQVAGPYMLGRRANQAEPFFLFDTRTGTRRTYSTRQRLAAAAWARGIALDPRPVYEVYGAYRASWIDYLVLALLFAPPLLGLVFGFRRVLRLRREAAQV